MIIDHLGIVFNIFSFRLIGRIAFPIFAFLISNGYLHTKNREKYALRLILLALVSEIPYDLFNYGYLSFESQNVLFTFLLGLFVICNFEIVIEGLFKKCFYILCIIQLFLSGTMAFLINTDYGFIGVFIICVFYFSIRFNKKYIYLLPLLLCFTFNGYGILGLFSLIFICLYNSNKLFNKKLNKYLYLVYPVQYLVLFILRILL